MDQYLALAASRNIHHSRLFTETAYSIDILFMLVIKPPSRYDNSRYKFHASLGILDQFREKSGKLANLPLPPKGEPVSSKQSRPYGK